MGATVSMGMCTTNPQEIEILKKYGYHTFESHFRIVNEMSDREFSEFLSAVNGSGVEAAGMNCFADPPVSLLGKSFDELDAYLEKGLIRPKKMGVKYVVIGSGAARNIPEGMSREAATEKFTTMLRRYSTIADAYEVDIVVEPLFRRACNFINTFEEALAICQAVDHPRIGCLMDFFHSYEEKEPFSVLEKAGSYLKHIHFSTMDRRVPVRGDEEETKQMAEVLKRIGYRGRVVLEGNPLPDFETAMREFSEQFDLFE